MQLELIQQPASDAAGDRMRAVLSRPDLVRIRFATAWMREQALRRLEPDLRAALGRIASPRRSSRAVVGVDLGGTTKEALELGLELFGSVKVFHHKRRDPPRTFHPKTFIFEFGDEAIVLIGSSNLTTGGLWGNFEATTSIGLDLNATAERNYFDSLCGWFDGLWGDSHRAVGLSKQTIKRLEADPSVLLPSEADETFVGARRRAGTSSSRQGSSVFGTPPTSGLRRIPPLPGTSRRPADRGPREVQDTGELVERADSDDDLRVLLALVPFDRWRQVGFNREVSRDFFQVVNKGDLVSVQGVRLSGAHRPTAARPLVFPPKNLNVRLEMPDPDGRKDSKPARTLLVILERAFRTFRYMSLRPGDDGYAPLLAANTSGKAIGNGKPKISKRVLISYGDLMAAWTDCPLRP